MLVSILNHRDIEPPSWGEKCMGFLAVYPPCNYLVAVTFFKIKNNFRAVLDSQQSWAEGWEFFHIPLAQTHARSPHQHPPAERCTCYSWWTYMTRHHHVESMVDVRVRSWCWTFCGLGPVYNDLCPHYSGYRVVSLSKNSLVGYFQVQWKFTNVLYTAKEEPVQSFSFFSSLRSQKFLTCGRQAFINSAFVS